MKKVAIILSGCGVYDGAEIHESVLTLLYLSEMKAAYSMFAPDIDQLHVVNHLTGEVMEDQSRNVLVESARIARGHIQALSELNLDEFDALILPGGFGVAKNLCDFAIKGADATVDSQILAVCQRFAKAGKPAGYACIAPAMMAQVYGPGVQLTIGHDESTIAAIQKLGGDHITKQVDEVVIDHKHKVASTPAYMLASDILEASRSIRNLVKAVLDMC